MEGIVVVFSRETMSVQQLDSRQVSEARGWLTVLALDLLLCVLNINPDSPTNALPICQSHSQEVLTWFVKSTDRSRSTTSGFSSQEARIPTISCLGFS